jgi:hydrogenase nickel incorporation protein HypA/HybF
VHELPVVTDIIKIVNSEAEKLHFTSVSDITLVMGELSSVMDESVQMYFELLSADTPCGHAKLAFERVGATLRCTGCGLEFEHKRSFDCPDCGGEALLVKGTGRELYIKSIEGE